MADTSNLTSFLGDVADAIREKKGTTEEIPAEQFDTEILSIETGGTEINNQDKAITENGVYTADEGYTGLGEVTVNVQADGVKLFKTEEEMQADTTAEEGDLAVVYGVTSQNITETSSFTTVTFPETVVLDQAVTDRTYGYFRSTNSGRSCTINVSATNCNIMDFYDYDTIASYSSSDGITYTRTTVDEEYTFSTEMSYNSGYTSWNDIFGKFMLTKSNSFEGLFQYGTNNRTDLLRTILMSDMTFDISAKTLTWNNKFSGPTFDINKLKELKQRIIESLPKTIGNLDTTIPAIFVLDEKSTPCLCFLIEQGVFEMATSSYTIFPFMSSTGDLIGSRQTTMTANEEALWVYELNLTDMTFNEPTVYKPISINSKYYYDFVPNSMSVLIDHTYSGTSDPVYIGSTLTVFYDDTSSTSVSGTYCSTSFTNNLLHPNGYVAATSQLTLESINELLPDKVGLGKNRYCDG